MNFRDADPETAWLAGVFEGEGCAYGYLRPSRKRLYYHARLQIQMTDQDVVLEVARIAGRGIIRSQQHKKLCLDGRPRKLLWIWDVSKHEDFQTVTERLYPYLGHRRRAKIEEIYKEAPWIPEPYFFEETA